MIGTILKDILEVQNINVYELSRRIGVSAQTLYSIIKRDNMKIDFEVLLKICKTLNVPVEMFYRKYLGDDHCFGFPSIEECDFIAKYRLLDDHGKMITKLFMDAEAERLTAERREDIVPKTKTIPLFNTPAAAGAASPALGKDYEDFEVPADSKADFASIIRGDGMEPVIPDGAIVLVSRSSRLVNGDVGLFFVDGEMKCKQYCEDSFGNIYLISLNREQNNAEIKIPAASGIGACCFGKVLLTNKYPFPEEKYNFLL